MKRVKGVEDLNICIIRALGIVGEGVFIHTCTVSCLVGDYRPTVSAGSPAGRTSFSRSEFYLVGSASSF